MNSEIKFNCDNCNSSFSRKKTLKRDIRIDHLPVASRCDQCSKPYFGREGLKNHQQHAHGPQRKRNRDEIFECAFCGQTYRFKNCLVKHLSRHQNNALLSFPGSHCQQKFKHTKNRLRYVRKCHFESNEHLLCPKSSSRKGCPKQRQGEAQDEDVKEFNFKCHFCEKKFRTKYYLTTHLALHENDARSFLCPNCGKGFKYHKSLVRHRLSIHLDPNKRLEPNTNNRFKCGPCNRNFFSKKCINAHYESAHAIKLETEKLEFNCVEEFNQWKSNIQQETDSKFFADTKWKNKDSSFTRVYLCHLSAMYTRKSKLLCVRMSRKQVISKKLSEFCPAEIVVKIKPDGKCYVDYLKTHVGHAGGVRKELRSICLDEEQLDILPEVVLGETKTEVIRPLQSDTSSKKVCFQISNSLDVNNVTDPQCVDLVDENSFLAEHENSILFLKDISDDDTRFNLLQRNDFTLVFMDENQEKNLQRYGENVIAVDEIRVSNKSDFFLHTLLVMDVNREGVPVAFLLTNRNDSVIVEIFLKCIRERVGIIAPKIFMSDMQSTYYGCWTSVMALPEFRLHSTWHVNEGWRRNTNKIVNKEKRKEISKQMNVLLHELDPLEFEEKLKLFLSNTDDDVRNFMDYFKNNYSQNVEFWAYCYRNYPGVNVNMSLGNFHRQLRYGMAKEKDLPWLPHSLNFLHSYLRLSKIKKLCVSTGVNPPYEVRELRKRHHLTRKYFKEHDINEVVTTVDEQTWFVRTFQEKEENDFADMYVVQKIADTKECTRYEGVDCTLPCQLCRICFHEFICNCLDSSIRNNMCRHIHAVGIFLRGHVPDTSQLVPDSTSQLVPNFQSVPDDLPTASDTLYAIDDATLMTSDDGGEIDSNQCLSEKTKQECVNVLNQIFRIAKCDEDVVNFKEKVLLPAVADIKAKCAIAATHQPRVKRKNSL